MKKISTTLLAAALVALASCASHEPAPTATTPNLVPQKLNFFVVGLTGPSYHIQLAADGLLEYTTIEAGKKPKPPLHRAPSPEQWQEFRHQLDRLKVWQWKPEYGDKRLVDGTQWSLDVEYSDKSVHSDGHRDFPDNYEGLLKAVGGLLGTWQSY